MGNTASSKARWSSTTKTTTTSTISSTIVGPSSQLPATTTCWVNNNHHQQLSENNNVFVASHLQPLTAEASSKPKRVLSMPSGLNSLIHNNNKQERRISNRIYPQSTPSLLSNLKTIGSTPLTSSKTATAASEIDESSSRFNDVTDQDFYQTTNGPFSDEESENCNSDADCVSTNSSSSLQDYEIPIWLCFPNPECNSQQVPVVEMNLNDIEDEV